MVIKGIYIYSIESAILLKEYIFNNSGLVLIMGVRRDANDETNGVGKSCMVEAVNFLLGASTPQRFIDKPTLKSKDILLILHIIKEDGTNIQFARRINKPEEVYIHFSKPDFTLTLDFDKWEKIPVTDFRSNLLKLVTGAIIPDETPSFASVREYIIRDEKTGFNEILLPNRTAIQQYEIISYLSGLPFGSEKAIQATKIKQNELQKKLAIINSLEQSSSNLLIMKRKLEAEINKLHSTYNQLKLPEKIKADEKKYNLAKSKLIDINSRYHELTHIKQQYNQNVIDLENKLKEVISFNDIEPFFIQMLNYFPEELKHNFEEAQNFYSFMVENRGKHFEKRIKDIDKELTVLLRNKKKLQKDLEDSSKILKSLNLVSDIQTVADEVKQKGMELAEIEYKIGLLNQKANINTEINKLKGQILKDTHTFLEIFSKAIDKVNQLKNTFEELMSIAYKEPGILEYEFENSTNFNLPTGRVKFTCKIEDEESHGRLYMKINIFDLSMLLSNINRLHPPCFLIHDGSYCKPDDNVKTRLLKSIHEKLNAKGQYFVTANVDDFAPGSIEELRKDGCQIIELNRENGHINRFFGFKF